MNGSALSAPHGSIGVNGFDAGRSPIRVSAVPASGGEVSGADGCVLTKFR